MMFIKDALSNFLITPAHGAGCFEQQPLSHAAGMKFVLAAQHLHALIAADIVQADGAGFSNIGLDVTFSFRGCIC